MMSTETGMDPRVNVCPNLSVYPPTGQPQLPICPSGGDTMQLSPSNPLMNASVGHGISPGVPRVKFRPPASMNYPVAQGLLSLPLHSPDGNGMQTSHNPTTFLNNKAADGPHLGNAKAMTQPVPDHNTVSNEQLTQLSYLSLSLAQLLERQQQLDLSSASYPSCISSLSDTTSSIPSVSNATTQPSEAPEAVKQDDPICDIIEQKISEPVYQMLPKIVANINVNQQEPYKISKDGENCGKIAEGGSKGQENKISENVTTDEGDEDGKKSKDLKALRSFKFALAEFTKEILKPAWKDGKVNKETYKIIVKEGVDKGIETQGPEIPQTKEKIDQYFSCSNSKTNWRNLYW